MGFGRSGCMMLGIYIWNLRSRDFFTSRSNIYIKITCCNWQRKIYPNE